MLEDDYCDIFCEHLLRPSLHQPIADWHLMLTLDNGDGLEFNRIERVHDIFMGTDSFIFHFDYLPFASQTDHLFIAVGFRLIVTVHNVDDSDIDDSCL